MDSSKKHVKPNPEEKANPLSVLFYWYVKQFCLNFNYIYIIYKAKNIRSITCVFVLMFS